jgi:hypothetical protein
MDDNLPDLEKQSKKDLAMFKNWQHESLADSQPRSFDYIPTFSRKSGKYHDRPGLKSDQKKRADLGLSNVKIIFSGFLIEFIFGAVAFQLTKNWYIASIVFIAIGLILSLICIPWIIATIRGVQIYSTPPLTWGRGGDSWRHRGWWIDALQESLRR